MSSIDVARGSVFGRRSLLAGAAVALAGATPARARQAATPEAPAEAGWTFTDDAGVTISLPKRPERVVAYLPVAAALWDLGVRPIAYYGIPLRPDGTRETLAGDLDLDALESLGEAYAEFDIEALAALEPDLIVNDMWAYPPDFWGLDAGAIAQIEAVAPIANILFIDQPVTETIARVEELAAALGADLDAPEVVEAAAAFDAAVADLEEAIAGNPGLTVAFVSGTPDSSFWVGNPEKLADVRFFRDLGLDVVQPQDRENFSEELSWEAVDSYPADLFIVDDRQWSATGPEMASQVPTFAALPAAKAGAFASWPSEFVPSRAGFTPALETIAAAVRTADPDIV